MTVPLKDPLSASHHITSCFASAIDCLLFVFVKLEFDALLSGTGLGAQFQYYVHFLSGKFNIDWIMSSFITYAQFITQVIDIDRKMSLLKLLYNRRI